MIYRKFPVGNNQLEVTFNTGSGFISGQYYFTEAPSCGNQYSFTIKKLVPGEHKYFVRESNTTNSWSGNVNVQAGVCHTVGLIK